MRKKIAIVNAICYKNKLKPGMSILIDRIKGEVGENEVIFTKTAEHAREVIGNSPDIDDIIVVGGDGSIFTAVNAMDLAHQTLGIIPFGRGNCLAKDLLIPEDIKGAISVLMERKDRRIDLIKYDYSGMSGPRSGVAVATTGLGLAPKIVMVADKSGRTRNRADYFLAELKSMIFQKVHTAMISVDGGTPESKSFTVLLCNNTKNAGYFRIFPSASLYDKMFDVTISRNTAIKQMVGMACFYSGKPLPGKKVITQAKSLSIELDKETRLMVDGEIFEGVKTIRFEIMPAALKIYA